MSIRSEEPLDPVEALVAVCLETPASERPATVDQLCRDHPEHAGELRRRLDALDHALDVLEPPRLEVPERLGDFRLLRRLGGGGMGVVYEAEQVSLGRTVALKLIRPEQLYFSRARTRFQREIEAVAGLQHSGIVRVYSVGEEAGLPFFAMERYRGCTLAEVLRALEDRAPESLTGSDLRRAVEAVAGETAADAEVFRGSWPDACIALVRGVAEALEHAHGRGILHRDVKPSNVALTTEGAAMLFDFGLTPGSDEERVTRTGAQMGTLPYMSPEQVRDPRRVGAASDVYSLGATLYELLTLQVPYDGQSPTQTQNRILEGRPDPIRTRNRRVPSDLEVVCLTAMDVDPGRRYANAEAFARDLDRLAARLPIVARPPGPLLRTRRLVQRHPAAATAVGLGALLIAGIPSALYLQERAYADELRDAHASVTGALAGERVARTKAEAAEVQTAAERERARHAADMAERSLGFLTGLFHRVSPLNRPGPAPSIVEMLEIGSGRAAVELADHPVARGRVQLVLGQHLMEFGRLPGAVVLFEQALQSFAEGDDSDTGLLVSETMLSLSDALRHRGELERSEQLAREQVEWARDTGHTEQLIFALSSLASSLSDEQRFDESDALYEELVPLLEDPSEPLAMTLLNHGMSLADRGRLDEALAEIERGFAIFEEFYEAPHQRLTQAMIALAVVMHGLGDLDLAKELYLRADEDARSVWGEVNQMSAIARQRLSWIARSRNDLGAAEEHARAALDLYRRVHGEDSAETVAVARYLGDLLVLAGRQEEAAEIRRSWQLGSR